MESCVDLEKLIENFDVYSQHIFDHSSRLAKISNITVSKHPISFCRQQHRSNPQHDSVADYFKKAIIIPFLDDLISDTSTRFTAHGKTAASIHELLPNSITLTSSLGMIEDAV